MLTFLNAGLSIDLIGQFVVHLDRDGNPILYRGRRCRHHSVAQHALGS